MDQSQQLIALLIMLGTLAARWWDQTTAFADPKTTPAKKISIIYLSCLGLAIVVSYLYESLTFTPTGLRTLFFYAALMAACSQVFHIFLNSAVPGLGDMLTGLFGGKTIATTATTTSSTGGDTSTTVVSKTLQTEATVG